MARAALLYWLGIFALGFVLGTVRVLWLAPALGGGPAVLLELPLMLAASWWLAARLLARFAIRSGGAALAMGLLALALLLAAELGLAMALGGSPRGWLAGLGTPAGLLGLAGQGLFGLVPWLLWRRMAAR